MKALAFVAAAAGLSAACNLPDPAFSCDGSSAGAPELTLTAVGGVGVVLITSNTTNTVSSSSTVDASAVTIRTVEAAAPDGTAVDGSVTSTSSTTTNTTTSSSSDASATVTVVPLPAPVAVALQLTATFACPVEGDVHATLTASVGQFTNGMPPTAASGGGGTSDSGSGGGSASGGTSGVTGASVTVLLGADDAGADGMGDASSNVQAGTGAIPESEAGTDAGPSPAAGLDAAPDGLSDSIAASAPSSVFPATLTGYVTLQVTTNRTSFLQAVVGDATLCAQLVLDGVTNAGPNALSVVGLVSCSTSVPPTASTPPSAETTDAGADAGEPAEDATSDATPSDATLDAPDAGPHAGDDAEGESDASVAETGAD